MSESFKPPQEFSFDPRDWSNWIRRFEHYHWLSDLKSESEETQVRALLFSMGARADDILATFQLSETESKTYDVVLKKFKEHFQGKTNVVYERATFGRRNQGDGESIDEFVTDLHKLSLTCEYSTLRESLIRDRIVLGVQDRKLGDKLMLVESLTLEKAVEICKQWEMVKTQQTDLHGGESRSLEAVSKRNGLSSKWKNSKKTMSRENLDKCKQCGRNHEQGKCPAMESTCNKCGALGHWAKCCRTKGVPNDQLKEKNMERVKTTTETFSIGAINKVGSSSRDARNRRWSEDISVDKKTLNFKLDPGADETGIPYFEFRKLFPKRPLQPADIILVGPDKTRLRTVGMCCCSLKVGDREITETVYVVKGLERPLLGLRACEDLNLVKRLNSVGNQLLSRVDPVREFPSLFTGLGKMDTPYTIKLKGDASPYAQFAPRRIPIPLMENVKKKLEALVEDDVVEPVDEPTEWCAPLVTVPKPDGDIRLCVDLTHLNKSVEREIHQMPVVEHTLGQLAGAKIFSKLDANSGFFQILLSENCRSLTTFITPFGRFRFKRLPFGISSAPEHFQKRMTEILKDITGVVIHIDDMLIFGSDTQEHDSRLREVLSKLKDAGVTLNKEKCEFGVPRVKFLGHIIDQFGVRPDPEKIEAIVKMDHPKTVTEVRQFMGMTNFLGRFVPKLAEICKPIVDLTRRNVEFLWGADQEQAFSEIKKILTSSPVLALYDPNKETILSSDASSFGLGALVLQKQLDGKWKPVAYASRTMTSAETRYAQIEKEALGITWACERFRDFLMGKQFTVETDHKPLLSILATKCVDDLTPRLQRFRIRLMRYSYDVQFVPGKSLVSADALSRQPIDRSTSEDTELQEEITAFVCHTVSQVPASDEKLGQIWQAQLEDPLLKKVRNFCEKGWPRKSSKLEQGLKDYWSFQDELSIQEGILMRNCRVVIPQKLRHEILGRIHEGHMGVVKCRARAKESCWWPGVSADISEMVRRCPVCVKERKERREPLIPLEFPTRPWQRLGVDLFMKNGKWHLLVVDYYSRYPEVVEVSSLTANTIIRAMKAMFSRHGVPEEVVSDNGPQFHPWKSSPFQRFRVEYGFIHNTSSPRYPQANGFAENGVKIVKNLLQKNDDWFKCLLEYRASPLANGYSPAELLMGRRIRTTLPINPAKLIPVAVDQEELQSKERERRRKQKTDYDRRHGVVEKESFEKGERVWIKDVRTWGKIAGPAGTPRSYIVETDRGDFRRNASHLTRAYEADLPIEETETIGFNPEGEESQDEEPEETPMEPRRSTRLRRPPQRLIEEV